MEKTTEYKVRLDTIAHKDIPVIIELPDNIDITQAFNVGWRIDTQVLHNESRSNILESIDREELAEEIKTQACLAIHIKRIKLN